MVTVNSAWTSNFEAFDLQEHGNVGIDPRNVVFISLSSDEEDEEVDEVEESSHSERPGHDDSPGEDDEHVLAVDREYINADAEQQVEEERHTLTIEEGEEYHERIILVDRLQDITDPWDASSFIQCVAWFLRLQVDKSGADITDPTLIECIQYACRVFHFPDDALFEDELWHRFAPILRSMYRVVQANHRH
ncbi:uncharacterized protein M421DRAFT_405145, partial [Didymella exigua CBS 183.55]